MCLDKKVRNMILKITSLNNGLSESLKNGGTQSRFTMTGPSEMTKRVSNGSSSCGVEHKLLYIQAMEGNLLMNSSQTEV